MPNNRPLLLDGAMGTELINRGADLPLPLWSARANLENKELVRSIHRDYINAGADILTTNTFRTTSYTYRKSGGSPRRAKHLARESLLAAVELARQAAGDDRKIAGSITAVDDCYRPELYPGKGAAEDTYGELIEWFEETAVDLLLFETMGNQDEIAIALAMQKNYSSKCWLSIILKDGTHLLDGTMLEDFFELLLYNKVDCILLNCNSIATTDKALDQWRSKEHNWGLYPNLGSTDFDNDYFDIINASIFAERFERYIDLGPTVIGACCGSTPKHIRILNKMIKERIAG